MEHPKPTDIEDELDPAGPAQDAQGAAPGEAHVDDLGGADADPGTAESRGLSDMLRKAMVAGLGAVFMTEEGIRTYVKDLKLPKDVKNFVIGQAERSKVELFRVIGDELHRFFESELLRREFVNLVSQMTLEVKAEIRLKPVGSGPDARSAPEVKVQSATVRRTAKKKKK
jgi:hypothetical protein